MKKKVLIFLLVMTLVLTLTLFVACNDNKGGGEQPPAGPEEEPPADGNVTVLFDLNGVGNNVEIKEAAGTDISARVPSPTDTEQYYFGGWYLNASLNGDAVTPATTVPESGATYHAKWYKKYAFNVKLEQLDGSYLRSDALSKSGVSVKGESSEVTLSASDITPPAGYLAPSESLYRITFANTSKDVSLDVELDLLTIDVTYLLGIEGHESVVETIKYGGDVCREEEIGDFGHRHFLGWKKEGSDEIIYHGGEALYESADLTLVAAWEIGLADIFGGDDYLYVSTSEQNVVYLERYGYEDEFKGTLNGNYFSFEIGLDGVIAGDGFYYFDESLERDYPAYDGSGDILTFLAHGKARFKAEGATDSVDGSWKYMPDRGIYEFAPDEGDGAFEFLLGALDGEPCFRSVNEEEHGNYIMRYNNGQIDTWWIFELDGLGNVIEHHDPRGNDYAYEGEVGAYEYDEEIAAYYIVLSDGQEYIVRFNDDESGQTVGGILLKGSFIYRDAIMGEYKPCKEGELNIDRDAPADLILDGFGGGTYKGEPITYTYEYTSWIEFSMFDEDYTAKYYYWITFEYHGSEMSLGIEESTYYGGYYVPMAGEPTSTLFAATSDINIFYGNDMEDYSSYYGMFFFKYGVDGPYVHVMAVTMTSLSGQLLMTELDYGVITEQEGGVYLFETKDFYFGSAGGSTFYFKYDANGNVVTQMYREEVRVDDSVVLDVFGNAVYTDANGNETQINYVYDDGLYMGFITFQGVPGRRDAMVYGVEFDEEGNMTFTYLDGFHMMTDTKNGYALATLADGTAYIGIPNGSYYYYYAIKGTYAYDSQSKTYSFEVDHELEEDIIAFLEAQESEALLNTAKSYFEVEFEVVNEARGECNIKTKGYRYESGGNVLELGSDGVMRLTVDGKVYETSKFYDLTEDIRVLQIPDGSFERDMFVKLTYGENGDVESFKVGGDEANTYYLKDELDMQLQVPSRYFIFVGDGELIMVFNSGIYSLIGDYEATGNSYVFDGVTFTEYNCNFYNNADDDIPDTVYTIAVAQANIKVSNTLTRVMGMFIPKSYSAGDFEIDGGGSLKGDGYHYATYIDENGFTYDRVDMSYCIIYDKYLNNGIEIERVDYPTDSLRIRIYDEDDNQIDIILFDVKEGKLYERDLFNGHYIEVINNEPSAREYHAYLDGHGNATIYNSDGEVEQEGVYRPAPELGENALVFTPVGEEPKVSAFTFGLFRMDGFNCYVIYDGENKGVFTAANGSFLQTNGFGQGVYVDKYGRAAEGLCTYLTSTLVKFASYETLEPIYFALDKAKSQFAIDDDEYLVSEGVLFRYQGTETDITLDDDIIEIKGDAFFGISLTSIDLNNVQIIGDSAFADCDRLASVTGTENLVKIGNYAFEGCLLIESLNLPRVESIGNGAFKNCDRLQSVTLAAISVIGQYAFSHETSSPMTIFDLTGCENLANLKVDEDAFVATVEGAIVYDPINMKALVKDVSALNALQRNDEAGATLQNTAGLSIEDDPMGGASYVSFSLKSVFVFDGGTMIKRVGRASSIYAVYVKGEAEDSVKLYVRGEDGTYDEEGVTLTRANTLTIDDALFFMSDVTHTLSITEGEETGDIAIRLTVPTNASFAGVSVSVELGADTALSALLSEENGAIRAAFGEQDTKYYDITVLSADTCSVVSLGNMVEILTKDEYYKINALVKDGKITEIVSIATLSSTTYYTRTIVARDFDEDGNALLTWYASISSWPFVDRIIYDPVENTIEVERVAQEFVEENYGSTMSKLSYKADWNTLKVTDVSHIWYTTSKWTPPSEESVIKSVEFGEYQVLDSDDADRVTSAKTVVTITLDDDTVIKLEITVNLNPNGDSLSGSIKTL